MQYQRSSITIVVLDIKLLRLRIKTIEGILQLPTLTKSLEIRKVQEDVWKKIFLHYISFGEQPPIHHPLSSSASHPIQCKPKTQNPKTFNSKTLRPENLNT